MGHRTKRFITNGNNKYIRKIIYAYTRKNEIVVKIPDTTKIFAKTKHFNKRHRTKAFYINIKNLND